MATWTNNDGITVRFGRRSPERERAGVLSTAGGVKEYVLHFNAAGLPYGDTDVTGDTSFATIPAGAVIVEAIYTPNGEAWAGGTSLDIGLSQADNGGDISVDGLFDGITTANLNNAALSSTDSGTNSGNALGTVLTTAAQVKITASGTYTAGEGKLVIQYVEDEG